MPEVSTSPRSPPVDYVVAAWLGTPKDEIARGLLEGWIRAPQGMDVRAWMEERGFAALGEAASESLPSPPSPEETEVNEPQAGELLDTRARLESLLRRIDPGLQTQTFSDAWSEAGADDESRAQRLAGFVAGALSISVDASAGFTAQLGRLEDAAQNMAGDARFVRLAGHSGQALEDLAAGDGSVRRALAEHSPWAIAGARELARLADPAGRYDRFDADTGELLLTDAWLEDRARYAAWRHAAVAGHPLGVDGDGWRFVDRAAGDGVSVTLEGSSGERPMNQVIFAKDGGDSISGGAGTDRIHGGHGDDMLRGRSGDDLLEGGAGDDALQGGSGRDHIAGQQGDDELDGGNGNDLLDGGSGDDELSGDRGDDLLRGGTGNDVYRFESGDGVDTIADDAGVVIFDDTEVAGTMARRGDGWVSADGRFRFALESAGDSRTLVIRATADGAHASTGDAVRVANWNPGAFGISLADTEDHAGEGETIDDGEDQADGDVEGEGAADIDADDVGDHDALSRPPPREPEIGQEAPWWSWPEAIDVPPLVDAATVEKTLAGWLPPAPPDIAFVAQSAFGVTAADVGDALADAGGDIAFDGDVPALALDPRSMSSLLPIPSPLTASTLRLPPDLVLRSPP